jgi:hypothetical protein
LIVFGITNEEREPKASADIPNKEILTGHTQNKNSQSKSKNKSKEITNPQTKY